MKLVRILVASIIMLVATPAATQAATAVHAIMHGNELLRVCNTVPDIPDEFDGCDTYIVGATDALDLVAQHLTNICRPQSHAIQQLRDIVVNWLGELSCCRCFGHEVKLAQLCPRTRRG